MTFKRYKHICVVLQKQNETGSEDSSDTCDIYPHHLHRLIISLIPVAHSFNVPQIHLMPMHK